MSLKKGFLIALEGIDGAGKTTQAQLLYDNLKRREFDVILTKEPTQDRGKSLPPDLRLPI